MAAAARSFPPSRTTDMRILLVEDDQRIVRDVKAALEAAGYVVDTVGDGETAWYHGDTEDYAAIVLDLGLPLMDGLSVLKRWRAGGRQMPVLILTARGSWSASAGRFVPRREPVVAICSVRARSTGGTRGRSPTMRETIDIGPRE